MTDTSPAKVPELLSPAGTPESLRAALAAGADAVYFGASVFSNRMRARNFSVKELKENIRLCHSCGARAHITVNTRIRDREITEALALVDELYSGNPKTRPDALIVADLGLASLIRKNHPSSVLHASTQTSLSSAADCRFLSENGFSRLVLPRELNLEEISAVSANPYGIETEMFLHGALCVSLSGQCLLSFVMGGRSGNRGECAQPCRWQYAVMEEKRPGEYMPVAEDEKGTYLFSARDLCLMPLLAELCEAGVSSLKIEGRMKTEYYVAVVTGAYRRALDLLAQGREQFEAKLPELTEELQCASHRLSDTGFLQGNPETPGEAEGFWQSREYTARVLEDAGEDGQARLLLKNRFFAGDELELMTPEGVRKVTAKPFIREKTGETLDTLGVAGETIRMELPGSRRGDMLRGPVRNHRTEQKDKED